MTLKQIWLDFAAWTTCHGVSHMVYTTFLVLKVFWTVVVVGATVFFIYQLQSYVVKFISYPSTIETTVRFDTIKFPVVTVCLVNPMKKSEAVKYPVLNYFFGNVTLALEGQASLTDSSYGLNLLSDELTIIATAKETYYSLRNTNFPNNDGTGWYSFNDLIVSCTYGGVDCSESYYEASVLSDFYRIIAREYGYCYAFNYFGEKIASKAGPDNGLKLILRSDPTQYLPITETTGFVLRINQAVTRAYPRFYGHQIDVGFRTNVAMTFNTNERLGSPYGTCTSNGSGYLHFYEGTYTVEGCYRSCYQTYVYKTCKCNDNRYSKIPNTNYDACSSSTSMLECANNILSYTKNKWNPVTQCDCPYPCSDATFTPVLSQAVWPPFNHIPEECYNDTAYEAYTGVLTQQDCLNWYASNTAAVEVYFQRMYFPQLQQTASYSTSNLLNDVGGNLGLTLGASVITIAEIICLGILCLIYCVGRNKLRKLAAKDLAKRAENVKKGKLELQIEAEQQKKAEMEAAKATEKAAKKAVARKVEPQSVPQQETVPTT